MKYLIKLFALFIAINALGQENSISTENYPSAIEAPNTGRAILDPFGESDQAADDKMLLVQYQRKIEEQDAEWDIGQAMSSTFGISSGDSDASKSVLNFMNSQIFGHSKQREKIDTAVREFTKKVISQFVISAASFFFVLTMILNYFNNVVKGQNQFDYEQLIKELIKFFVLIMFVPLFTVISSMIDAVPEHIENSMDSAYDSNVLAQFAMMVNEETLLNNAEKENVMKVAVEYGGIRGNTHDRTIKYMAALMAMKHKVQESINGGNISSYNPMTYMNHLMNRVVNKLQTFGSDMVTIVLGLLGSIAKYVVGMLIYSMDKLLFALGPLAFMVSFLRFEKDQWKTWVKRWLTVKCSLITLVVVDAILLGFQQTQDIASVADIKQMINPLYTLAYQCVAILMYIMVFWITSAWIGSESAGAFLSKAAALATGGATSLASGLLGGGGLGGGGGSSSGGGGAADTATKIAAGADHGDNANR